MPLHDSRSASFVASPVLAAVTLFLLRNRQITGGSSPGSGVTIAGAELLVHLSATVHAAVSVSVRGFSLLLRVAAAPLIFAVTTLQSELRVGLTAIDAVGSFLQHAATFLIHTL